MRVEKGSSLSALFDYAISMDSKTVRRTALCRCRRELSNEYLLATFGFDTAEKEPCKVCPLSVYRSTDRPGNLSLVRCTNLQELVYKQGQAGIVKASVTIRFNNSDPKMRPHGYNCFYGCL